MYKTVVVLQTVVLPLIFGSIDSIFGSNDLIYAYGLWWAFWGVGTRLVLAGVVQFARPDWAEERVFGSASTAGRQLLRELSVANIAFGLPVLLVPAISVVPISIALPGALYLGAAGLGHFRQKQKSSNEALAMTTDIVVCIVVLATFVVDALQSQG